MDVFRLEGCASDPSCCTVDRKERSRQPVGSKRGSNIKRRVRISADIADGGDGS